MKISWIIIFTQTLIISYLLITSKIEQELPKQSKSLERLRNAACSSALLSKNCLDYSAPNSTTCSIAFTFAALIDIRLRFTDFSLHFPAPSEAKHHNELKTKKDMLETLAYSFSTGRAAEFRVSKELFDSIIEITTKTNNLRTLGGNGATMSFRAAHEGCDTYLISPLTAEMTEYFPKNVNFLNPLIENADIHIALEYEENES